MMTTDDLLAWGFRVGKIHLARQEKSGGPPLTESDCPFNPAGIAFNIAAHGKPSRWVQTVDGPRRGWLSAIGISCPTATVRKVAGNRRR